MTEVMDTSVVIQFDQKKIDETQIKVNNENNNRKNRKNKRTKKKVFY